MNNRGHFGIGLLLGFLFCFVIFVPIRQAPPLVDLKTEPPIKQKQIALHNGIVDTYFGLGYIPSPFVHDCELFDEYIRGCKIAVDKLDKERKINDTK